VKNSTRARRERARRARARRRQRRQGSLAGARLPSVLHALTTSALALPGIAGGAAAQDRSDYVADFSYSRYREDDLKSSKVYNNGETGRYEIDIYQLRLAGPLTPRIDLALDVVHESMSGASPWYVRPEGGSLLVVMTGATIDDQRTDTLLSGTYALDRGSLGAGAGVSVEKDYLSLYASFQGSRDFNDRNTTLSAGLGGAYDQIDPTQDASDATRISHDEKGSITGFAGLSQVLGSATAFQSTFTVQHQRGYLSDPYKQAYIQDLNFAVRDDRPDDRTQFSVLARLRHHVRWIDGTLHFDYRYHHDDWEVDAHTFEAAWHQSIYSRVRIIPSFRYYSQSQAYFYAPFYASLRSDGHASSDYRLSPFGAVSYRIRGEARIQVWKLDLNFNAGYERYESDADYALGKVSVENPGLVAFDLWSVGVTGSF
jgi:hypothetical protein